MELPITFCFTPVISKGYLRTRHCQKEWGEEACEKWKTKGKVQLLLKSCCIAAKNLDTPPTTPQNAVWQTAKVEIHYYNNMHRTN